MTSTVTTQEWTKDDRALLLALQAYEATLCSGCSQPKTAAWHAGSNGYYEGHRWVCQACTAAAGHEVVYQALVKTPEASDLVRNGPFDLLESPAQPTETPKE